MNLITVKHNFETAHRLPFLIGKCQSIHGHSWQVEWTFEASMDENGLSIEYGALKKSLREWIDTYLDHGAMLGVDDKLLDAFLKDGSKVFIFGAPTRRGAWMKRPWPTVEAVAELLGWVGCVYGPCVQVRVQETAVNAAIWEAEG